MPSFNSWVLCVYGAILSGSAAVSSAHPVGFYRLYRPRNPMIRVNPVCDLFSVVGSGGSSGAVRVDSHIRKPIFPPPHTLSSTQSPGSNSFSSHISFIYSDLTRTLSLSISSLIHVDV